MASAPGELPTPAQLSKQVRRGADPQTRSSQQHKCSSAVATRPKRTSSRSATSTTTTLPQGPAKASVAASRAAVAARPRGGRQFAARRAPLSVRWRRAVEGADRRDRAGCSRLASATRQRAALGVARRRSVRRRASRRQWAHRGAGPCSRAAAARAGIARIAAGHGGAAWACRSPMSSALLVCSRRLSLPHTRRP